MDRHFLATFHPLIRTVAGRRAAQMYGLPPFIDGSCRREPDFEAPFPSVTAICRAASFAPRLRSGDTVMYLTVKGRYRDDKSAGWRLVAVLHVVERFESHELAAAWYRARRIALPNNCIVPGNDPKSFELTHGRPRREIRERAAGDPERAIRLWDAAYRRRVERWSIFLACRASFLELHAPPQIRESDFAEIFGRTPATQTPPSISTREFSKLLAAPALR
jgi:hypothetical protein